MFKYIIIFIFILYLNNNEKLKYLKRIIIIVIIEMSSITPLPFWQICCVLSIQISEAMNIYVLFPFIVAMVQDFGYSGSNLGYYTGGLSAAFCGAQFITAIHWGKLSDKYGRKPILIFGTIGAGLGMLIFGFSKDYTQAIFGRFISGLLSGNLGVIKSFLTEITDETNRGKGFAYLSLSMSIGAILGPLAGGLLSQPAEKYKICRGNVFLETFPFVLPCMLCCVFTISAALCTWWLMIDTKGIITPEIEDKIDFEKEYEMNSNEIIGHVSVIINDDSDSDSEDEYDDVHALSCLPCVKTSDEKVHPLWRRRVVVATCNYGMIAMSYILIDETIPLFLQLDKDMGGFSFSTSQVGILYSYTGFAMLIFTSMFLPSIAGMRKAKLFIIATIGVISSIILWPITSWITYNIINNEKNKYWIMWTLLIISGITRNCFGSMHYNAVMVQVNEQVASEHLGIVNGLGQSIASISRAIGPTIGGVLWSFSINYEIIFLNFIGAVILVVICQILNCYIPPPKILIN
jgi:MFS family permease